MSISKIRFFSYTPKIQCKGVKKKNKRSEVRLKAIQLGWKRGKMQRPENYLLGQHPGPAELPVSPDQRPDAPVGGGATAASAVGHLSEGSQRRPGTGGRALPPSSRAQTPRSSAPGAGSGVGSLLEEPGPARQSDTRWGRCAETGSVVSGSGRERRDLESCQGSRPDRGQRTPPLGKGPSCLEKRCGDVFWENICN